MKFLLILALVIPAVAGAQTAASAAVAGWVLDAKTQKPVPAAVVMAIRSGLPPLARSTKSGGDGGFDIRGLPAGVYRLCVQAEGGAYLDPCLWGGVPTTVTLVSGQAATGVALRLSAGSVVNVQVRDPQKVLTQATKEGRRPELAVGVSGTNGLYYPARAVRGGTLTLPGNLESGTAYRIVVPRDTLLKLSIGSRDVRLGDAAGTALAGNARQETFQHATGDTNAKIFVFTVLGLLP